METAPIAEIFVSVSIVIIVTASLILLDRAFLSIADFFDDVKKIVNILDEISKKSQIHN